MPGERTKSESSSLPVSRRIPVRAKPSSRLKAPNIKTFDGTRVKTRSVSRDLGAISDSSESSCKYSDFENEQFQPLGLITSHIHELNNHMTEDEQHFGVESDYRISSRPNSTPLLSSTVTDELADVTAIEINANKSVFDDAFNDETVTVNTTPKQISIIERRDYSASKDQVTQSGGLDSRIRLAPPAIVAPDLEVDDDPAQSMSLPSIPGDMATPVDPKALEAEDILVDSQFVWEDDFDGRDVNSVPEDVARRMVALAIKQQDALRSAYISVRRIPADQLGNLSNIESLNDLRRKFVEVRDLAQSRVNLLAVQPPQLSSVPDRTSSRNSVMSEGTQSIITSRVNDKQPTLLEAARRIKDQLDDFVGVTAHNNQAQFDLEGKLQIVKEEAREVVESLKSLAGEATTVGIADAARDLSNASDDLCNARTTAMNSVQASRNSLGIPAGPIDRHPQMTLKAPVFKGSFKDGMDFFTFEKALTDYLDSNTRSNQEKLIRLKSDCLSDAALEAVGPAVTFADAVDILKEMFGKPQILIAVKTSEILALGSCPETLLAKRRWLINMSNKYNHVKKVATQHGLVDFIASSDITQQVIKALPKRDRDEFQHRIVKFQRRNGLLVITKNIISEKLADFLDDQVEEVGGALDFNIINGYGNAQDLMKALELEGKPRQSGSGKNNGGGSGSNNGSGGNQRNKGMHQVSRTDGARGGPNDGGVGGDCGVGGDGSDFGSQQPKTSRRQKRKNRQQSSTSAMAAEMAVAAQASGETMDPSTIMTNRSKEVKMTFCQLCEGQHEYLSYCEQFRKAKVISRWGIICNTGACYRCLRMDAGFDIKRRKEWYIEHKPFCNSKYVCRHGGCEKAESIYQNHITICKHHIMRNANDHKSFYDSLDRSKLTGHTRFFYANEDSDNVANHFVTPAVMQCSTETAVINSVGDTVKVSMTPVYMLQYIPVKEGPALQLFYDSGCMEAAMNERAYAMLDCTTIRSGPINLDVAGGRTIVNQHGYERFELSKCDGSKIKVTALRMNEITNQLPLWELQAAWKAVSAGYVGSGGDLNNLPTCPKVVGGSSVDIMLGVEYMNCFPELVYELPSGLRLYRSRLDAVGGHLGILGGPHESWARAAIAANIMTPCVYLTAELRTLSVVQSSFKNQIYFEGPCAEIAAEDPPPIMLDQQCIECGCWDSNILQDSVVGENSVVNGCFQSIASEVRRFLDADSIGSEVGYRCSSCRNCNGCKRSDELEHLSLQEEMEQAMIEKCVVLDVDKKVVVSTLPFIKNPTNRLNPNRYTAQKVFDSQIRMINKTPRMREAIQKAHGKLKDRGHVVRLDSLDPGIQDEIKKGPSYFIPWRSVENVGSISSPHRIVFDASARTPKGDSLNDLLAKGQNKLGRLLHLLICFRYGFSAFAADVAMAYNNIKLDPSFYKFQLYLWEESLTPESVAAVWVVITLIYGVKPAGNLTMAAFIKVVDHAKTLGDHFSLGAEALEKKSYMDDIFGGYPDDSTRDQAAVSLVDTLALGSMTIKAVTKSGLPPPEDVTADGESVGVVGYKWYTESDTMGLEIKPLTLGKAKRGTPAAPVEGDIAEALEPKFTKRVVAGRVASVYDPLGLVTPLTARLKLDMSEVCKAVSGWDDKVPGHMLETWVENLVQIRLLSNIRVPRNVGSGIPGSQKFHLVICTDASQSIAAAVAYARSDIGNGKYDCNLIMSKSKLVLKSTVPRAELRAATLGASLARVIRQNLGGMIQSEMFVTDSTIAMFWMHQDQRPLQLSVRNSVIEIRRLTELNNWYHIPGIQNPADIPTRPVDVKDFASADGEWFKGKEWMKGPVSSMPLKTVAELTLTAEEKRLAAAEIRAKECAGIVLTCRVSRVSDRYKFSKYLIDPCSTSWRKYLRRMAVVIKCVNIWCRRSAGFSKIGASNIVDVQVSNEDVAAAERYTFLKTSREVKYFCPDHKKMPDIVEQDGILMYVGRIMDGEQPVHVPGAFIDVEPMTFSVPVVDRYSPVGYSVMLHSHETETHHGSAGRTLRRCKEIVHIIKGKAMADEVRENCPHCRRYKQNLLRVELGKIHPSRFTPAPPFYFTQCDLVGHFLARCEHKSHRANVKVWGCVFKCSVTLAIWVEVMEDYSSHSFVNAYIRFSARFGHVGVMFVDPGANLVSACEKMEISYADIAQNLNAHGTLIEHKVCPTAAHQSQGIVERSIREVRNIFQTVFQSFKLTILGYSTAFHYISNELNNIPLLLGSKYENLGRLDLITPNRLLMGRNNLRAPVGLVQASTPSDWLETMEDVGKAWWNLWKEEWMLKLVPKPDKFVSGNPDLKVGDIVVYQRDGKKADLGQTPWMTGKVHEVHQSSRDKKIRSVILEYKNSGEQSYRYTTRSVRTMAKLYREGDVDLVGDLGRASTAANKHFLMHVRPGVKTVDWSKITPPPIGGVCGCSVEEPLGGDT